MTFARARIDAGDGSFSDLRVGADPLSQALADFNNDGQVDAVVAVSDAGGGLAGIKVFQPMPTVFPTLFQINSAAIATSVVTGDFNSDGEIDIAVGFIDLSTVTIFTGDGQGNFPTSTDVNIATGVVAMAAADFNGDGKMDLAVAEGDILGLDNKVKVLSGNGNNTFQNAVILSNAAVAPGGLVTGDINGDNTVDLVVADLTGAAVSVFAGQGNGSFSAAASFAVGQNPKSVTLGDFNMDGKVDLVSANEGSNTVSVLRGNGDGTFLSHIDFVVGTAPRSVAAGDFNRDGKPDMVVANWGSNNISVLEGRGTGNFAPPEFFATGYGPSNVAVHDLDQDGYPDLNVLNLADSTATVLYNNGPSMLTKVTIPDVTGFSVTADFNGDGHPDLANSPPFYVGTNGTIPHYDHVDIRLGNGDGTFQTPIRIDVSGFRLATGDFNRDGIADLVVTDIAVAHVFLGNGNGTFADDIPYSTGLDQFVYGLDAFAATGVTVSDFNGDQSPDLLFVSNRYRSGTHSHIGIALGNGDGTFSQSQMYGPTSEYERILDVVVADFNGDGRSDVADSVFIDTVSVDENIVRLRLGGSTLGAEIKSPVSAASMVAGDFTGDGKTDLAVVSSDFSTLRLYPGNGDGTFGDSVFSSSGFDYFYDLATSDVNGDGRLDLVANELLINRGGYGVATYLGNGDGTFQLPYFELTDSYSFSLVTADFDQNGLPDVFSSNLLLNLPVVVTISSSSVAENLPVGTVVGTLSTAHPDDPGNFFSYTLISGTGSTDNGAFTLDPDGTLKTAAIFDRETKASYSIRLKSTDSIGVISEKVVTISVENVLEPPQGTSDPDAFVLTFSSTGVTITQSSNGGIPLELGLFPLSFPIVLNGLAANDSVRIVGTSGHDLFTVSSAGLVVNGTLVTLNGPATRTLAGGAGSDTYRFDADNVLGLYTLEESSFVSGGFDTVSFAPTTTTGIGFSLGSAAVQTVHSTNLSLRLTSTTAFENLFGGDGNDILSGNSLPNTILGNAGNDRINGAGGSDAMSGGNGDDLYVFTAATSAEADSVNEAIGGGTDTLSFETLSDGVSLFLSSGVVQPIHTNRTLLLRTRIFVENVIGGSGDDDLTGNESNNTIVGNAGNDRLHGLGGNDLHNGGTGNDTYVFSTATAAEADRVIEGTNAGIDTLTFSTITSDITLDLTLTSAQSVHLNRTLTVNSRLNFENLLGGFGNDTLTGNGVSNTIFGNAGNDAINSGDGNDFLYGGLGADSLTGGVGNDSMFGGGDSDVYNFGRATALEADTVLEGENSGSDTLNFAGLTTSVIINLGSSDVQAIHTNRTLLLSSRVNFENVLGGSAGDQLIGNAASNVLVGNGGNDQITGVDGRDILIGGLGLDTLNGGAEDDILIAGRTTQDAIVTNLLDLQTEWTSASDYATRTTNLRTGVGPNLASLKAADNVLNDLGDDDSLTGGSENDWYFQALDDVITDLLSGEAVDLL